MPRLQNRGYTARAPDGAGSWPEIPDFDSQLSELDGGRTNAALQRWNDLVRARLGGNEQQDNGRFKNIQTTLTLQSGYLESVWTMQAIAGPVVTGMTLFASTGPDDNQNVSYIAFQADRFLINTAADNRQIFSATASEVKLGDVLTVDLANAKVFIGTGTYANNNTAFYVDDDGYFSLKNKLTFDPTGAGTLTITGTIVAAAGSIGGWLIGPTYIIDAAGLVGMSSAVTGGDDIRFWAGNITLGSAPFRVYESGAIFSSSGTIGGFTIGATTLSAGAGSSKLVIDTAGAITFGTPGGSINASYAYNGFNMVDAATNVLCSLSTVLGYAVVNLNNAGANKITFSANMGTGVFVGSVTASAFAGDGSSLTALNASNISSGTLANARLPSAISVTTLDASSYLRVGDGSAGVPTLAFGSDSDTGVYLSAAGTMNFVTSGTARLTVRDAAIVCLVDLKLNNAKVGGSPTPGGTVLIQDSTGASIQVIVV